MAEYRQAVRLTKQWEVVFTPFGSFANDQALMGTIEGPRRYASKQCGGWRELPNARPVSALFLVRAQVRSLPAFDDNQRNRFATRKTRATATGLSLLRARPGRPAVAESRIAPLAAFTD